MGQTTSRPIFQTSDGKVLLTEEDWPRWRSPESDLRAAISSKVAHSRQSDEYGRYIFVTDTEAGQFMAPNGPILARKLYEPFT